MTGLTIVAKRRTDPPDLFEIEAELRISHMYVIEGGASSGDSSVAFRMQDASGNEYIAQLTGNLLRMAAQSFNGMHARFQEVGE
jgi:hypothetical protein